MQLDVSVIIVNYNTSDLLYQCVRSVYSQTTKSNCEVIVVDNNSSDGSVAMVQQKLSEVILVSNTVNRGFSKANNQGIRRSNGRYVLLLNSDTVILDNAIDKMVEFAEKHADVYGLGPKLLNSDGTLQKSHRAFPSIKFGVYKALGVQRLFPDNQTIKNYYSSDADYDKTIEVETLSAACLMIRKSVLEHIGLLDEQSFMYAEDADMCYRLRNAGGKVVFFPETEIIHHGGQSSQKNSYRAILAYYQAFFRFYDKYYFRRILGPFSYLLCIPFVGLACVDMIRNVFRKDKRVTWNRT